MGAAPGTLIVLEPGEGRIASGPGSSRTRNQTLLRQQSVATVQ